MEDRTIRRWWFQDLPHVSDENNGIANNWWQYIIDPNQND
jgi:hypothetical protein